MTNTLFTPVAVVLLSGKNLIVVVDSKEVELNQTANVKSRVVHAAEIITALRFSQTSHLSGK